MGTAGTIVAVMQGDAGMMGGAEGGGGAGDGARGAGAGTESKAGDRAATDDAGAGGLGWATRSSDFAFGGKGEGKDSVVTGGGGGTPTTGPSHHCIKRS